MSSATQGGRRRILLVIAGLCAGGAERQMTLLTRGLDRSRYEVGLLIFNAKDKVHYQDVFEQPLWFRALGLSRSRSGPLGLALGMVMGIRRAVADFQPDLIHTSLNVANVAVRATGLLCFRHIPVVTSVRNDFLSGYPKTDQIIERLLSSRSTAIIANAESTRQQLVKVLPLVANRIVTIENGIDPRFSPGSATAPEGWPAGGRIALVVGRLAPQKNHLAMIEALRKLDAQGQLGDWRFVLVGEGPLRGQINAAVAEFPRFNLLPPTTDLLPYYRNTDLLLLPSLYEGMSNVALEAQACGVPVALSLAANASGVVTERNGYLLKDELAEALADVLAQPAVELQRRGTAAREDILASFGADRLARRTEEVYATCLEVRNVL